MSSRLLAAAVAGALAAACTPTETRTVVVPATVDEACRSYGLTPGSDRYNRCVQREIAYRRPA